VRSPRSDFAPFRPWAKGFLTGGGGKAATFRNDDRSSIAPRSTPVSFKAKQASAALIKEVAASKQARPQKSALARVMAPMLG